MSQNSSNKYLKNCIYAISISFIFPFLPRVELKKILVLTDTEGDVRVHGGDSQR